VTANTPETAIACPAWPSFSERLCAIGLKRLTGMNSDATSTKLHSAIA
jgi:hypothetical protein